MRSNRELVLAALAMILIGGLYLAAVLWDSTPRASGFLGHSLGVLGFVLMLSTETLYSLRKRSTRARWGRMSSWMQFHIFTGIVGPYLVLLHTAWRFQGLAGVVTLLTLIVVLSGFIGRYIYTAVPRNADGVMVEVGQLQSELDRLEADLRQRVSGGQALLEGLNTGMTGGGAAVLGRVLTEWRARRRWRELLQTAGVSGVESRQIMSLLARRSALTRQVRSVQAARQMLAVWHSIHIPIGMALFAAAFVHIGAALYYATLQP
ncbi:MAG: hypothetical protein P8X64_02835 [Anaerolineales bacterium]